MKTNRNGLIATVLAASALVGCTGQPSQTIATITPGGQTSCEERLNRQTGIALTVCSAVTEHVFPVNGRDLVVRIAHQSTSYGGGRVLLSEHADPVGYRFTGTYTQTPGMTTVIPVPQSERRSVESAMGQMGFFGPYAW